MFIIKLYSAGGLLRRIIEAQSLTVLRSGQGPGDNGEAEITLHGTSEGDVRYDIKDDGPLPPGYAGPLRFARAIIENSAGQTTEIISLHLKPA